jgi:hypothetical protein
MRTCASSRKTVLAAASSFTCRYPRYFSWVCTAAGVGGWGSRSWSNFHRPCRVSKVMSKVPSLISLACKASRMTSKVSLLTCTGC